MKRVLSLVLLFGAVGCQDVAQAPTELTGPTPAEQSAQAAAAGTTTRLSPNVGRNGDRPAIDGDRVVWVATDFRVRLYDISTETERQISSSAASQADIDGNWIVWSGSGVGATDIYTYDLSTDTEQ
ncbi:MAG TPA: hypothetical protein VGR27_13155, partial [Longimicrobiaceae bacterium]|nr:hypothetical protein [Longimicrobiaceae bacterium]